MDQRALSTPPSEEGSVESLARWLGATARSDRDRARAAFRWITSRIRYDVAAYRDVCSGRTDTLPSQEVAAVLERRTGVCAGYARLYEALGRAMGLDVRIVRGHCRTAGQAPDQAYGRADAHAWNAVRIDGRWRLVDSTWGSGHLDGATGQFSPCFQPFYFFTPPEALISSHLPEEAEWQLLSTPISETDQKSAPLISCAGFQHGLKLPDRLGSRVRVEGTGELRVETDGRTVVGARLRGGSGSGTRAIEGTTMVERDGASWTVQVACPSRGAFVLEIYVGDAGGSGQEGKMLTWATALRIESTQAAAMPAAFPRQYGIHAESGARLVTPRHDPVGTRGPQHFEVVAPGAVEMYLFNESQQVPMTRNGTRFSCDVTPRPGTLALGARYTAAGRGFTTLVQYQAR